MAAAIVAQDRGLKMGRTSSVEEIAMARMVEGRERRRQPRFSCAGVAEVVALDSGLVYRGELKDLSLTGCYILNREQAALPGHADVELSLSVNGDPLNAPARVVVVRPDSGAAYEFLPVDPEMRAALLLLIQKLTVALEDPREAAAHG